MPQKTAPYADVVQTAQPQEIPDIDNLPYYFMVSGHAVDDVLNISTSTRLRLEKSGRLKVHRFGRSKRYSIGNLRELIATSCETT